MTESSSVFSTPSVAPVKRFCLLIKLCKKLKGKKALKCDCFSKSCRRLLNWPQKGFLLSFVLNPESKDLICRFFSFSLIKDEVHIGFFGVWGFFSPLVYSHPLNDKSSFLSYFRPSEHKPALEWYLSIYVRVAAVLSY